MRNAATAQGTANELMQQAAASSAQQQTLNRLIASHTGLSEEEVRNQITRM